MAHSFPQDMSAESLSKHLSENLPVHVSPQDVTAQPQLAHLLEDLTHRLTPTGALKTSYSSLKHASTSLRDARLKYLEATTLHRVAQDVLLNMCDDEDGNHKDMRKMLEALTLSELQDHLMLPDGSDQRQGEGGGSEQTLFSITPENVVAKSKSLNPQDYIEDLSQAMDTFLEQEWTKITAFLDPNGDDSDTQEPGKVVERLEATKLKLAEENDKLTHSVIRTHCLSDKVHSLLLQYNKALRSLVSKQRMSRYPAQHLATSVVALKAYSLKLRCLEMEILTDTYNSETVPALALLHTHLQQRKERAEEALTRLRHTKQQYEQLGPEYDELVKKYAKVQGDLQFAKEAYGLSLNTPP